MTLRFLVRYQTLQLIETGMEPRQGSSNYLDLQFTFVTEDWQNLRKTLYVSSAEHSEPFVLESDVFRVPKYYTQQPSFNITMLGDADSVVVPTNELVVYLSASNNLWMATPPDPQNSAYLELLNSLGDLSQLQTQDKSSVVGAINELKESGVGGNGKPGFSPTVSVEEIEGGNRITITDVHGEKTVDVMDGKNGADGKDGAPGADGLDGKDGVIALSGATVGQIAKITAVDENGVPTAWEPVDMPSGEKEWKHIRTIVLEEDVQYVSVTTDEDGNPFEFDEIVIRSVTMAGDDGKNLKTGAMWVNDIGLDVHSASTALYFGFYARHNPGYFSPVVVYLHPFCDCFALHCWYHDNGVSTDAFLAGKYAAYNDAIKNTSLCTGIKQPTNMFDYSAVNGQNLVHGVKVATKITAFSYGAPFADHLMAKGSIFEFYGR